MTNNDLEWTKQVFPSGDNKTYSQGEVPGNWLVNIASGFHGFMKLKLLTKK